MWLTYWGHACFELASGGGTRVILDPYDDQLGYPPIRAQVDAALCTHSHGDHCGVDGLAAARVITGPAPGAVGDIAYRGVPTFHDDVGGAKRGDNTVFVLQVDGLTLCHLGDLGHVLSPEQAAAIGQVDVLMVPIGGFYTLDAVAARSVVAQLAPRIAIGMHYKTRFNPQMPVGDASAFAALGETVRQGARVALNAATLPPQRQVWRMACCHESNTAPCG